MMIILFIDLQTIVNNQTELIQNIHEIFRVYLLSFPLAAYSIRDWLHHIIFSWCWSMSHNDTMRLQFGAFYSLPCQTEKHCHESSLVFYASSHFTIARSSRFFFSCCLPILLYSPLLLSSYFSALHSFICPQSSIIPCHYSPLLILFSFFLKSPWNFRSISLVIPSPHHSFAVTCFLSGTPPPFVIRTNYSEIYFRSIIFRIRWSWFDFLRLKALNGIQWMHRSHLQSTESAHS